MEDLQLEEQALWAGRGVFLIEIFDDGEGLRDGASLHDQGWHRMGRIDRAEVIGELLALEEIDRRLLERLTLQPDCDTHPVGRDGPLESIKLEHRHLPFRLPRYRACGRLCHRF